MQNTLKKYNKPIMHNINNIYKFVESIYIILDNINDSRYTNHNNIHNNRNIISNNIKQNFINNQYLPINIKQFIIEKNKTNKQYIHDYTIEIRGYIIKLYLIGRY